MKSIILRDWEVKGILAGNKTMTRRVVKPQPEAMLDFNKTGVMINGKTGNWCEVDSDTEFSKQRLYGRNGREYIFTDAIRWLRDEGLQGLVSVKGTQDREGIYLCNHVPRREKENKACSQAYMRSIPRRARACNHASSAFGRESEQQRAEKFGVGYAGGKLDGQEESRTRNEWGESPDGKVQQQREGRNSLGCFKQDMQSAPYRKGSWSDAILHTENLQRPVGTVLYVRETWADIAETAPGNIHYKASATDSDIAWFSENGWKWRPSINMPREAARIFLRVTGVGVECICEITLEDIEREGFYCDAPYNDPNSLSHYAYPMGMRIHFSKYWDEINAKRGYGWNTNPWCWVYTFERISKDEAIGSL